MLTRSLRFANFHVGSKSIIRKEWNIFDEKYYSTDKRDPQVDSHKPNEIEYEFNPKYLNKNPKNLEWSGHAYKRDGWNLHYPPKNFYHECSLVLTNYSTEAFVKHFSGKTLIKVSSNDWYIRKHLKSVVDRNCVINIARILANRCFDYGIASVYFFKGLEYDTSKKMQLFHETLLSSGLALKEPEFVDRPNSPGLDYDNQDFYHDRMNVKFPPDANRKTKKTIEESKNLIEKLKSKNI